MWLPDGDKKIRTKIPALDRSGVKRGRVEHHRLLNSGYSENQWMVHLNTSDDT